MSAPPPPDLRDEVASALRFHWNDDDVQRHCEEAGLDAGVILAVIENQYHDLVSSLPEGKDALLRVAERVYARFPRYALQEAMWRAYDERERRTTDVTRRDILDKLKWLGKIAGRLGIVEALNRVWALREMPSRSEFTAHLPRPRRSGWDIDMHLEDEIDRRMVRNPGDWEYEDLFQRLDALNVSERRFFRFLEMVVNPPVREREAQKEYVDAINSHLRHDGVELREESSQSGYPIYQIVLLSSGVTGRPKNIIFASRVRPDLRFTDAINNDVEIASHADEVLVFDRPIPVDGLRWRDLQQWWAKKENLDPTARETKEQLYLRLVSSLPSQDVSPPQRLLFTTFYGTYRETFDDLPALLPEVWLHYDPKTAAERGRDALLRQRMDFLMLFARGVRIVIEVDGRTHYADDNGRANPSKYAQMVAADRGLRLAGYEVYRFGAFELQKDRGGEQAAKAFLKDLFARHMTG